MVENRELLDLRKSIDNLDNAIVAILAERFRLTERVGVLKTQMQLPAEDAERERAQEKHYLDLAAEYGLDGATLLDIMKSIIGRVKKRHMAIRTKNP